jgi:hypothetical protein
VVRYGNGILEQVFDCRIVQILLSVAKQVLEVSPDNRRSRFCNSRHHRLFVVRSCFSFDHADSALGTGADAGTQTVAEEIGNKPGLPVNNLERSLRAVGDALTAPRAFVLIDADDLPFHIVPLPA